MSTLAKVAIGSALVIGIVAWVGLRERAPAPRAVEAARASEPADLGLLPVPPIERAETPGARASVPAAPAPVETPEPAQEPPETIAGRAIDPLGAGVAGVELGLRASSGSRMDPDGGDIFGSAIWNDELRTDLEPLAVSGSDGRFTLERPRGVYGRIVSQDERWETVLAPFARAQAGAEQVLVVAPCFRLAGTVLDETGRPLAGVELRFGVPRERLVGSGADLEDTLACGWGTESDAQGRFSFERLPAAAGARLRAKRDPFETAVIERELWADDELEIVLERPEGDWLAGIVEARGEPVAGAAVALGTRATKTDERGGFQIHLAGLEKEQELCAAAAGFLPARLLGDRNEDGTVRWPSFVRLSLAGEPLALAGTVVDAEGRPMAGQEVWITEGRKTVQDEFPFLLESILAGKRDLRLLAKSDEQGRFRIAGLEPHNYHLRVVDPRTALMSDFGPYAAGATDLRLTQPTDELWPVVRGVVVSRAGTPVPELHVNVERDTDLVGVGDSMHFGFQAAGAGAETDEEGRFELHDVPKSGVHLSTFTLDVVDPELELGAHTDPLDVRVVVDLWVSLEVRAGSSYPGATSFSALDAEGEAVLMKVPMSGGTSMLYRQALTGGRSPVVSVGDRATTLVLYQDAMELARIPLALQLEIVNTVDL